MKSTCWKGNRSENASWPDKVENMQICSSEERGYHGVCRCCFATNAGLVHAVTNTDCWAQNGSIHGRLFAILNFCFKETGPEIEWNSRNPFRDVSSLQLPFKSSYMCKIKHQTVTGQVYCFIYRRLTVELLLWKRGLPWKFASFFILFYCLIKISVLF